MSENSNENGAVATATAQTTKANGGNIRVGSAVTVPAGRGKTTGKVRAIADGMATVETATGKTIRRKVSALNRA